MYKLASNLQVKHQGEGRGLLQPRTGKGIRVGPRAEQALSMVLGHTSPTTKEEVFTRDLFAAELLDRGIIIPASDETADQYFDRTEPMLPVEQGFFGVPSRRVNDIEARDAVAFLGVPADAGASRPGCRYGPALLRDYTRMAAFRGSLYSLSQSTELRPESFCCDVGNLVSERTSLDQQMGALQSVYENLPGETVPFMVGGDHGYTLSALRGLATKHPEGFTLVQFDSHLDLQVWGKFKDGRPVALDKPLHSNFVSHAIADIPGLKVLQIGAREFQSIPVGRRDQVTRYLRSCGEQLSDLEVHRRSYDQLSDLLPQGESVYLTIDVDVLSSAELGHTGFPNPTGTAFSKLYRMCEIVLAQNNIIGVDLMEFGRSAKRDEQRQEGEVLTTLMAMILGQIAPGGQA